MRFIQRRLRLLQSKRTFRVSRPMFRSLPNFVAFRVHQRYHFECRCQACTNDWPLLSNLPTNVRGLPKSCYKDKDGSKKLSALMKNKAGQKTPKQVLQATVSCTETAERVLQRPHALLCQLEDEVHCCLIELYG